MLMTKNGILDTAAQARAIDLGQFSVYLKTRIAAAPAGIVTPSPLRRPRCQPPKIIRRRPLTIPPSSTM